MELTVCFLPCLPCASFAVATSFSARRHERSTALLGSKVIHIKRVEYQERDLRSRVRMARLVSEEDSEIVLEVPTGDTVLGRGPLLKVLADPIPLSTTLWVWHFPTDYRQEGV